MDATLKCQGKFSINWTYLNAIASGVSAIDLGGLALRNKHDAREFVREYGFDIDNPHARAVIARVQREALDFVCNSFLTPSQAALIPPDVASPDDPLDLLVFASLHGNEQAELRRMWSCAVLKVMHGIFYIENNLKLRYFNIIRQQVFASLDEVIRQEGEQHFLSDGEICLPLLHFDRKNNKSRNSILLKLLQKAAYLAADIFDHLGVRLIFNTRFECLLALRTLQRAHVISVTNVDAQRTRNTLLDMEAAKEIFTKYRCVLEAADGYPAALLEKMDAELMAISSAPTQSDNPHSGAGFNSIQVTVRKMIHVPSDDPAAMGPDYDIGFFFEYEIQLMDKASHSRTLEGPASHDAYKKRQVETARLRVLGRELIRYLEAQPDIRAA
ncbi:TIGR04552 family protein [Pseudoduganella sp. DS3]|uniref:TIGR04552 family protein n=1 Tax=Pseudoduganella guangdongensis TaxID=2692179 RepID=A0A6N9HGH3_9BURK|nr:TIGR04552 family protein [Pseudoduganella guangdongensis]MYN02644.1 TIGR04552 family protein [Pseudoduganella guangdongensis]